MLEDSVCPKEYRVYFTVIYVIVLLIVFLLLCFRREGSRWLGLFLAIILLFLIAILYGWLALIPPLVVILVIVLFFSYRK